MQEHDDIRAIQRRRQRIGMPPRRIELLRGSIATTMRASPTRARRPAAWSQSPWWWAKSSRSARRRVADHFEPALTLRKFASESSTVEASTPTAAPPPRGQRVHHVVAPEQRPCTSPMSRPRCTTVNALPSLRSRRAVQSNVPSSRTFPPAVQHPRQHFGEVGVFALTINRPRRGTVRTR